MLVIDAGKAFLRGAGGDFGSHRPCIPRGLRTGSREAMTYGLPLMVCFDSGDLKWFVEAGVPDFVVEPTGRAIADAIEKLRAASALSEEMGREASEPAKRVRWENALAEVRRGLSRVTG